MERVPLSADEALIEHARDRARANRTTLNQMFREWLQGLSSEVERTQKIDALFARCDTVDAGGKFRREEMNGR